MLKTLNNNGNKISLICNEINENYSEEFILNSVSKDKSIILDELNNTQLKNDLLKNHKYMYEINTEGNSFNINMNQFMFFVRNMNSETYNDKSIERISIQLLIILQKLKEEKILIEELSFKYIKNFFTSGLSAFFKLHKVLEINKHLILNEYDMFMDIVNRLEIKHIDKKYIKEKEVEATKLYSPIIILMEELFEYILEDNFVKLSKKDNINKIINNSKLIYISYNGSSFNPLKDNLIKNSLVDIITSEYK